MKKVMLLLVSFLLLSACGRQESTKFTPFSSLDGVVDYSYLEKCLEDAGIKYFVRDKTIYVSNPDRAMENCS
jgi:hypothetical protein